MSAPASAPKTRKPRAKSTSAAPKARKPRTDYFDSASVKGLNFSEAGQYRVPPKAKAYSDTASFKKSYSKISPECQSLVDMVLDPDSVDHGTRWPNTYGLSSTYKSVNTINAAFDVNKQSVVYVHPRLTNAIMSTAGNSYSQALTISGTSAGNFLYQDISINEDSILSAYLTAPWFFKGNHAALPIPTTAPVGSTNFLYPISWSSTDTSPQIQFTFTNIGSGDVGQVNLRTRWYDASFAQLKTSDTAVQGNGVVAIPLNDVVTFATSYISFEIFGAQHPYMGRVLGQLRETGAAPYMSVTLPNIYTHVTVANLNGANLVSGSSEEYIILAQSLLCTHVGSTLQDGGVIATARVPSDTAVGEKSEIGSDSSAGGNNHYNWIASLQNNRYEGKVKNGSYSFFLGDDETSYFYRPVQQLVDDMPYLIAAFSTTDTASSIIRIKIITHIQFKSNSNVYAQEPSPYMKDVKILPHLLSIVNSSYSNEGHKSSLKDTLKSIGKHVGKALVSPKTWMTIAEIMAMLAL